MKDNPARGEAYRQLLTRNDLDRSAPTPSQSRSSMYAYDAVFAEVAVDARLGMVRVRRMLGVLDAGASSAPSSPTVRPSVSGSAESAQPCSNTPSPTTATASSSTQTSPATSSPSADARDLKAIYPDGDVAGPIGIEGLGEVVLVGGTRPRQRRLPRHRPPRARTAHHRRVPALNQSQVLGQRFTTHRGPRAGVLPFLETRPC